MPDIIIQKNLCLDFTKHNWLSQHYQVVLIYREKDSHSSHMFATAPWRLSWFAEMILRKCIKRCLIGTIVNRQFSMSFAFEVTSGQWCCSTKNWTCAFGEFQQHLFRDVLPNSLETVLFHRIPLLFGTRTNEWPLSSSKFSGIPRYESSVCQTFFFIVFRSTRNVVKHCHEYTSSCESFWCFS